MLLEKKDFFENEMVENKATKFYKKISLAESRVFQGILVAAILSNVFIGIMSWIIKGKQIEMLEMTHMPVKIIAIICELAIIFVILSLSRIDDYKFNKLVENGIVLRATIDISQSGTVLLGGNNGLRIHCYYELGNGEKLIFDQIKRLNIKRTFSPLVCGCAEEILNEEGCVNVLVNPTKCREYYIMFDEIGIASEKKNEAIYGEKYITKMFCIIILLEFAIWLLIF